MTQLWVGRVELWENEEQMVTTVLEETGIKARSCWFVRNHTTMKLEGYGFLDFKTSEDASEVLRQLQDQPIPHNPNNVFKLKWGTLKRAPDQNIAQKTDGYSVYVANLPYSVDEAKLLAFFRKYLPNTISAKLIRQDGISRGYGFVRFNTYQEMNLAIKKLHQTTEFGKPLQVREAAQNRQASSDMVAVNTVLFIKNLDPNVVKESTLMSIFSSYGKVLDVKISNDHPDWATVTMETHEAAEIAKNNLQNTRFGGATRCDIQYGKKIDEGPSSEDNRVTVPIINPKKNKRNKKLDATVYSEQGVNSMLEVLLRNDENNREAPIQMTDALISNRISEQESLSDSLLYQWCSYSDTISSNIRYWYY